MTQQGVDYSFDRPGGAALRAAGKTFACRYVPYLGDGGKGLTLSELADLQANGLAVSLVYESTSGRSVEGYGAGAADGQQCLSAGKKLGFPANRPFYFAVDFDAAPEQFAALDDYLLGAGAVLGAGRVGVYGSKRVIDHCRASGSASWFWLTYAWSGGMVTPCHLYQYLNGQQINGAAVDFTEGYGDDFGQWPATEDSMTPDELARLERLERIVVANGIAKDLTKPNERTTGADALKYADDMGWSAFLGLGFAQQGLADHAKTPHAGGGGAGGLTPGTKFTGEITG